MNNTLQHSRPILVALAAGILLACGGGGGSNNLGPQIIERATSTATTTATTTVAAPSGIQATLPAGSVSQDTSVVLEVRDGPVQASANPSLRYSNRFASVRVAQGELVNPITVKLPTAAAPTGFHRLPVMIADDGTYAPAAATTAVGGMTEFTIDPNSEFFGGPSRPGGRANRVGLTCGFVDMPEATGAATTLGSYGLTFEDWAVTNRIALCVHGILGSRGSFQHEDGSLVSYLLTDGPDSVKYDEVWYFEYDFTQSVSQNGLALANALKAKIEDSEHPERLGQKIDIYAHSMGGLVSRWAIEQEGAAHYVKNLFMLGTPNNGASLANLSYSSSWVFFFGLNDSSGTTWRDFVNSAGHRDLQTGSQAIRDLNASGSYRVPTAYYTIAGNDWAGGASDRVVAIESVNLPALANQSMRWEPYEVAANHFNITASPQVRTIISTLATTPEIKAQLVWDTDGTDMDLHFVRPGGSFFQVPGDCYYSNKTPDWGELGNGHDDPALDFDDTNGYGAENIILKPVQGRLDPGKYSFYVSYYSGSVDTTATIRVWTNGRYRGSKQVTLTYDGGSAGNTYRVCEIDAADLANVTFLNEWTQRPHGGAPQKIKNP